MQTLYFGGPILTMTSPAYAEALLVEDGRILAVGGKGKLLDRTAPDCRKVDLQGAALLPAFIDPHSHFSSVAMGFLQANIEEAVTAEEITERIQRFIAEAAPEPGAWVQARGYDHNVLPGAQHLPLSVLDAMAPDHPLLLAHQSGHCGLVNTLGLQALGLTPDTPDPEGGRYGRAADGSLTGYLEENAFMQAQQHMPTPDPQALVGAYAKAQRLYASHGITTMQEGMMVGGLVPLYQMLLAANLLQLDVVAYPDAATWATAKEKFSQTYQGHVRLGGIKMFLDGSPQGRTAWMCTPYTGTPDYCGYGTMTDEAVRAVLDLAAAEQVQVLAHCNGDAAAAQYLNALQQAEAEHPVLKTLRPVMIHAQLLHPDQLALAKEVGVVASFFVAHVYHWGDVHIRNFGLDRAALISPTASALRAGVPFTFHQDAPVIPPDMLETVWCATNRRTKAGVLLGPDERIAARDALRAVTATAAWQYFEEGDKGTLAPGKRADLVILDRDPLTTPSEDLRKVRVLQTVKDGQTVFEA